VERRRETVDIVLGVLGFFTLLLLVSTVLAEVRGDDSLARAVTLAVFVALLYALLRMRRALIVQQSAVRARVEQSESGRG
jgi:hypothetical protein